MFLVDLKDNSAIFNQTYAHTINLYLFNLTYFKQTKKSKSKVILGLLLKNKLQKKCKH